MELEPNLLDWNVNELERKLELEDMKWIIVFEQNLDLIHCVPLWCHGSRDRLRSSKEKVESSQLSRESWAERGVHGAQQRQTLTKYCPKIVQELSKSYDAFSAF